MTKTFQSYQEATEWHEQYDPLAPKKGDLAPDFLLRDTNGENPVRLSELSAQRPVALVFGSFT
jgi:hypothetical protein